MESARSIYSYDNYRTYLRDLYAEAKVKGRKYSFGYFSKLFGFSSKSFFKHVIDGQKNLSEESIEKVSKGLKFNREESNYFKNLVLLNQAGSTQEKEIYAREIIRSRAYRKIHPLKASQLRYFTHWYYIVVREMVNLQNFKEDPEWIAANTKPNISVKEAREAIEELLTLGLLTRDDSGKLIQANTIVSSGDEVTSSMMAQFHREFMKRASESIDLVPRENRDISTVTFRVSPQTAKNIKEKIQKFRKELMEEASRDLSPQAIFQLNLQLFPVTSFEEEKKSGGNDK